MVEPKYIWERYGEKLSMNPNKNYLIFYRGCFCPPHIGHYNLLADSFRHDNVRGLVYHINSNKRHGVSKDTNRMIWEIYIKELFEKGTVNIIQHPGYEDDSLLTSHKWFKHADYLVIIRGDEMGNDRTRKYIEKSNNRKWGYVIGKCNKYKIKPIFYYPVRESTTASATKFIKEFKKYNFGVINRNRLYKFLPNELKESSKNRIIDMLSMEDIK